jgi:hypothetical protein
MGLMRIIALANLQRNCHFLVSCELDSFDVFLIKSRQLAPKDVFLIKSFNLIQK